MLARKGPYSLLPPTDLVSTGPVDHADWNFRFPLGWISRRRLALASKLLPPKIDRLLKIGYGSGVHLPHWKSKAAEVYGIDPHPHAAEVTTALAKHGVAVSLTSGSAESMPYPNGFFDCILAISAVEFIPDLPAACQEMRRVLRPEGCVVVVTPGRSPVVDWGLKLLTGQSAETDYADRRAAVVPTLLEYFVLDVERTFPAVGSGAVCLYRAVRVLAKGPSGATP